jgi:hypothetical protein
MLNIVLFKEYICLINQINQNQINHEIETINYLLYGNAVYCTAQTSSKTSSLENSGLITEK